jgi:hypothetical protein
MMAAPQGDSNKFIAANINRLKNSNVLFFIKMIG